MALLLVLAGLYALPDAERIPPSNDAEQARIENALATIRKGADTGPAVRDLALVGEAALPAIARRLNEAGAGERLHLLTAIRRMPRGAVLLEQARDDPHPAVRAWVKRPPPPEAVDLRVLATRYLDLLSVTEERLRRKAEEDLKRLEERMGRPIDTFEVARRRMQDRRLANEILARRREIRERFALAGGRALRHGELEPDLDDAVFVAFLALLREEYVYDAVSALVALGPRVAPALEACLPRPNHDPKKILRILCAVREDGGRGLYDTFGGFRPEVQRALVVLAPEVLADGVVALLERAALAGDRSVRAAALDELLAQPSPAGRDVARTLLDPERYGPDEFGRAAKLLARCGEVAPLARYATLSVPDEDSARARTLRSLREKSRSALQTAQAEELGVTYLASDEVRVRALGINLVRDRERLLAHARGERDERLAETAARRALRLHGKDAAAEVLAVLNERGADVPFGVVQELRDCGAIDLLVDLAASGSYALRVLGDLPSLDAKYAPALLALHDAADEERRIAVLEALLPLGGADVRKRFVDAGAAALPVLYGRARSGRSIPFALPLRRFLEGAEASRLESLALIAEACASVEPGLFADVFAAWEALEPGERQVKEFDGGAAQQKVLLLAGLARSSDEKSVQRLFDRLVTGDLEDHALVLGILEAAARHLPEEQLERLLPILRAQIEKECPGPGRQPPPENRLRDRLLQGCIHALAYRRVEAALDDLCGLLLEPRLYLPAYDWDYESWVLRYTCNALRWYGREQVGPAFERALARAEADGRLAALDPGRLFELARLCRKGRRHGRWLAEVSLAIAEVLERLPFDGEATYYRMLSLGQLGRYADAAAAARADAAAKRARGFTETDGFWTPERLDGRALLYDALAERSAGKLRAAVNAVEDPVLFYLAAFYARVSLPDLDVAQRAASEAVRRTGFLYHDYRDVLASVRIGEKRPGDALRLLDPRRRLPVQRRTQAAWYRIYEAQANLLRGDELKARHALERGLSLDRRLLPYARSLEEFKPFADLFAQIDEERFDELFELES